MRGDVLGNPCGLLQRERERERREKEIERERERERETETLTNIELDKEREKQNDDYIVDVVVVAVAATPIANVQSMALSLPDHFSALLQGQPIANPSFQSRSFSDSSKSF